MEYPRSKEFHDIWQRLSIDAQRLAIILAVADGLSQGREYLEAMSVYEDLGFDLDHGLKELGESTLLQQITLIEERRELLAKLLKSDDVNQLPSGQTSLPKSLISNFRYEIERYEADKKENPEKNKAWDEPRYRLTPEFQYFLVTNKPEPHPKSN